MLRRTCKIKVGHKMHVYYVYSQEGNHEDTP